MKIGDLGHLFVLISLISAIVAAFSYWKSTRHHLLKQDEDSISWKKFARILFYVHAFSVLMVVIILFMIIYQHRYDYYYAWDHSSNYLPWYYMISCFWEGQEGSFLLWIFWHVVIGVVFIRVNRTWETPVMTIFCAVQAFLVSMITGVAIFDLKIGSSAFMLLREQMPNIPVFATNPDFVPTDGSGLNLLLQNYWMVIHPPTLFLGFALTLIPFAYCISGLWLGLYKEWVRPALPWALFCAAILGTGILMGGYWAYETLNFGGYWNWDPVENAVFVPWLILIASIHTMISHKNSGSTLMFSIVLTIATFILILYSTFLTRSGILGEASVHSFTDLGLSGQLLIYLLTFTILSIVLIVIRWKKIPGDLDDMSFYSRELWVIIGMCVLCCAAFQVSFTTSYPVFNSIMNGIGVELKLAAPSDPVEHFSSWQIWFAILILLLSGIGQFFWWKKMEVGTFWNAIFFPVIFTLLISSILIGLAIMNGANGVKISYILLFTASIFCLCCNVSIFIKVVRGNYKLSGGAIAHIGVALMLLGILFSAGYSRVITYNNTGKNIFKTDEESANKENSLLYRHEPTAIGDFEYIYRGPRLQVDGFPGYVNKEHTFPTQNSHEVITRRDLVYNGEIYFKKGDTLSTDTENIFYQVDYVDAEKDTFTLYPRLQANKQMGNVASPDIKRFLHRDIYSHLSSIPVTEEEREWTLNDSVKVKLRDTLVVAGYYLTFDSVNVTKTYEGMELGDDISAVNTFFSILGKDNTFNMSCPMLVNTKTSQVYYGVAENIDLGIKIGITNFNVNTHEYYFDLFSTERDFIVLKALEKPMINLLWIGTIVLVIGIFMAFARRYSDFVKMRDKNLEV